MNQYQSNFGKLSALAEVASVFFIGSFISQYLFYWAGITSHPLFALTQTSPDMLAISYELAKVLLLQYAGWLGLALVFTKLQRQSLKSTRIWESSGAAIGRLIIIGLLAWVAADLFNKIIWILDAEFDLGTSVPWREALLNADKTFGWWVLMAVGSFALIPIIEEVFWRGFVQKRLAKSFSPIAAIVTTAIMFTLSHSQYHFFDFYHLSTITSLFVCSLVLGWVYHKTESLLPVIIAHGLLNFPVDGIGLYAVVGLMLFVLARHWGLFWLTGKDFFRALRNACWGPIEIAAVMTLGSSMFSLSLLPQYSSWLGFIALPIVLMWCAFMLASPHTKNDTSRSEYEILSEDN